MNKKFTSVKKKLYMDFYNCYNESGDPRSDSISLSSILNIHKDLSDYIQIPDQVSLFLIKYKLITIDNYISSKYSIRMTLPNLKKFIHRYIWDQRLQDMEQRRLINLDDNLISLFKSINHDFHANESKKISYFQLDDLLKF